MQVPVLLRRCDEAYHRHSDDGVTGRLVTLKEHIMTRIFLLTAVTLFAIGTTGANAIIAVKSDKVDKTLSNVNERRGSSNTKGLTNSDRMLLPAVQNARSSTDTKFYGAPGWRGDKAHRRARPIQDVEQ